MGTRHLIAVVQDEKVKVAQYGQFDGYLSGAGEEVISFIKDKLSNVVISKKFSNNVRESFFVDEEFLRNAQLEAGLDPDSQWVSHGDPAWERYINKYPQFSRNTSTDVLDYLCENSLVLVDNFDFGKDGLFCEYAYVIDLDKELLSIYTGFSKVEPTDEDPKLWGSEPNDNGYYPVKLFKNITFEAIITYDGDMIERLKFEKASPEYKADIVMDSISENLIEYVERYAIDSYLSSELEALQMKLEQYFKELK